VDLGLAGKGVLVTGASGAIGEACARAFADERAHVAVHYHRGRERAELVAATIGGAPTIQADLTVEADSERLFSEAREALGRIDVCAAVAGVWPEEDLPLWQLPLDRWHETMAANLTATYLTARAFLREVERNGAGNLVMIGSTAGIFGEAGHADYAAAKSAIAYGLLLSLKNEIVRIAPAGRVNVVCPGWTVSPMTVQPLAEQHYVSRIMRTMPLRKLAVPEDVAAQVVALASDVVSGHVTGQIVTVAGGMEGRIQHDD
jgi:3-oxoacyl-[acyl-carrier protein] reductase